MSDNVFTRAAETVRKYQGNKLVMDPVLPKLLPDEKILGANLEVVVTDLRLFILEQKDPFPFNSKQATPYMYSDLLTASYEPHILDAEMRIRLKGLSSIVVRVFKDEGPILAQLIQTMIMKYNSPQSDRLSPQAATAGSDVTTLLQKLGDLHKAGVLTDEEFAKKKAELLSRM